MSRNMILLSAVAAIVSGGAYAQTVSGSVGGDFGSTGASPSGTLEAQSGTTTGSPGTFAGTTDTVDDPTGTVTGDATVNGMGATVGTDRPAVPNGYADAGAQGAGTMPTGNAAATGTAMSNKGPASNGYVDTTRTAGTDTGTGTLTPSVSEGGTATASTDLNLRAGPGSDYGVERVIPANGTVKVVQCADGAAWCKVDYDGTTGWAYTAYLTDGGPMQTRTN